MAKVNEKRRAELPPLNALVAFNQAATQGSFSRAAKAMGVAQPSITRHVAHLEQWLGISLFDRGVNSVELTAAGQILAKSADQAFDVLCDTVRQLRQSGFKSVVLGCSIGVAHLWVMPRLAGLRALDSQLDLSLLTSERYHDYERNNVDLSIRFGLYADDPCIIPEQCVPLASPDFAARHGLTSQSLATQLEADWLLRYDEGKYGWLTWEHWFELQGVRPPGEGLVGHHLNYPLLIENARAGEGIVLGNRGLVEQYIDNGSLVIVGPQVERAGYGYHLLKRSGHVDSNIDTAVRWLKAEAGL